MAIFNSSKIIYTDLKDLSGVVNDTKEYFQAQGYEVKTESNSIGSFISLSKGGLFKSILGMKTSLNVNLKYLSSGISIEAKVGILGQQIVPSLIMYFVAWPVIITQISGLISQAKLDDEVLDVIERAIKRHESSTVQSSASSQFCVSCGASIAAGSVFCPSCGANQS